jgi:prepilin-type N-terminal cleavage/methylation domain-containing protein
MRNFEMQRNGTITDDSAGIPEWRLRHRCDADARVPVDRLSGHQPRAGRSGFSMLELQVALVLFGIALAGLGPLVVMHSRQLQKMQSRLSPQTTYYLIPPADPWVRKLGAAASVATAGSITQPGGASATVNDVQIQSLDKTLESQTITAWVTVKPK